MKLQLKQEAHRPLSVQVKLSQPPQLVFHQWEHHLYINFHAFMDQNSFKVYQEKQGNYYLFEMYYFLQYFQLQQLQHVPVHLNL